MALLCPKVRERQQIMNTYLPAWVGNIIHPSNLISLIEKLATNYTCGVAVDRDGLKCLPNCSLEMPR